jgi:ABC-type sugar transport system ATPase subunit
MDGPVETPPYLAMRTISKRFPGVQALDRVSFDLRAGEVHALVGENGAGKSTLMKILSGVYQPDAGTILLAGEEVTFSGPRAAREHGIAIVHQELNLFPNLTVAENVFGGDMPARGLLALEDRTRAAQVSASYLSRFGLSLDTRTLVRSLSIGQQQVVEIARALAQKARVLILDEPTSSLAETEAEVLFNLIDQLRADGMCVIYISHRLEEIFRLADRVTVLRDGEYVATRTVAEIDIATVIRLMVGRQLEDVYGKPPGASDKCVLRVEGLASGKHFDGVSFELHAGEILGMAGLIGAGRSEVGLTLFGALPMTAGSVELDGRRVHIGSPQHAIQLGIAYLTENRRSDGLFLGMAVRPNISVSHLARFARFGMLNMRRERAGAQQYVQALNVQTPGVEQAVMKLSGGNQQKVLLARWLAIHPRVLIVDEPTRGVDVGAKVEIYTLLRRLAADGVAILLISSELPEVLGMADRILVMHEGKLTGALARNQATEEQIMTLATNQAQTGIHKELER